MRQMINVMAALTILAGANAAPTSVWGQDNPQAAEGSKLYKRVCFACHASEAGQNKIGPSLFGVAGRKAGTGPGFSYSQAMKDANVTWNDEAIDQYITDPKKFVPGNKMVYAGLKKEDERKEIIAYLKTLH